MTSRQRAPWLVLLLALSGCPSGKSLRGVEHDGTKQARAKCPGKSVDAWVAPGLCVTRFAGALDHPRHLVVAPNGDLFVATRKGVVVLWDANGDGDADSNERGVIDGPDLSHQGIAFSPDGRWLYLADSRAVRRLPFHPGMRRNEGPAEAVITDVPLTVDHPYRTITFDREGRLYLAVGAEDNLSPGGGAVIMRYAMPPRLPNGGVRFASGERYAVGLRNPEALAWDHDGRLWAFVNGRDFLRPEGTAESFYLDHPGDGIFRLADRVGAFYGFPNCWVLGPAPWGDRKDPASQWADPDAHQGHDDAWCANRDNVEPAAGALAAHTAPLGAVEYTGDLLPATYKNRLFVTSHGSWNRHEKQRGRTILAVRAENGRVVETSIVVGERGSDGKLHEGEWSERPVGVAQGRDGALYVTSDETGNVLRIGAARE